MAARPRVSARRALIGAALAAALAAPPGSGGAQNPETPGTPAPAIQESGKPGAADIALAVVSRERILREAVAARRLREAEEALTEQLQGQIDETKAALAAEEAELAQLRNELPGEEFESRVAAYDERVRLARRNAQERAAVLQKAFQDARAAIVAALPALMERLRVEAGAGIVLNADGVLALDPALDLTDRAIAMFDAEGPSAEPPALDFTAPLSQPWSGSAVSGPVPPTGDQPPAR